LRSKVERVAHVIGRDLREDPAVVDEAANRDAAEADAVIALLAADDAVRVPCPIERW
jgi:hypothetical protein